MTRYTHQATGLNFERRQGSEKIYVTGNTYEHRQALRRAGFRWDADEKRYEGTPQAVASLDVPRSWDVASALGIRTKGKIGGGRVVR